MTNEKIEFHEVANIFPLMEVKEFDDLKGEFRTIFKGRIAQN